MTPPDIAAVAGKLTSEELADVIRPIIMRGFRERLSANQVTDEIVIEVRARLFSSGGEGK